MLVVDDEEVLEGGLIMMAGVGASVDESSHWSLWASDKQDARDLRAKVAAEDLMVDPMHNVVADAEALRVP